MPVGRVLKLGGLTGAKRIACTQSCGVAKNRLLCFGGSGYGLFFSGRMTVAFTGKW